MMTRLALACVCLIAVVCGAASPAFADQTADCQLFEIKASNEGVGIDPALKPLERKLKKPPFTTWKSFKVLARHSKRVERMKPLELGLKPGGKLTLLYRNLVTAPGKKARLRLSIALDNKSGKRVADVTVTQDSGDYNLIAGEALSGGAAYILATSCTAR